MNRTGAAHAAPQLLIHLLGVGERATLSAAHTARPPALARRTQLLKNSHRRIKLIARQLNVVITQLELAVCNRGPPPDGRPETHSVVTHLGNDGVALEQQPLVVPVI